MKKKINTTRKGNVNQRRFKQYMAHIGYQMEVVRNTKHDHSDYWGIADLVGFKLGEDNHWCVVQVKSNQSGSAIKKMKETMFPDGTLKIVAVRLDGKGGQPVIWRIITINPDGSTSIRKRKESTMNITE